MKRHGHNYSKSCCCASLLEEGTLTTFYAITTHTYIQYIALLYVHLKKESIACSGLKMGGGGEGGMTV